MDNYPWESPRRDPLITRAGLRADVALILGGISLLLASLALVFALH
jgi:hypothetical protein